MDKLFDECFEALGDKRVKEIGLWDDGDGIEGGYEKWCEELWVTLEECMSVGSDGDEDKLIYICGAGSVDNANDIIEHRRLWWWHQWRRKERREKRNYASMSLHDPKCKR